MKETQPEGKDALIRAARMLFAEHGIETLSLREVARTAGHGNTRAVQYHFGDRAGLLNAVIEPLETEAGVRRHTLLDEIDLMPDPSMRAIAGALVRPSAALLQRPDGRDHLQIVAQLVAEQRFDDARAGADNGLKRWSSIARQRMPGPTLPLHRRFSSMSLCFGELRRRAASRRRPNHRLYVSDLVDLVAGVLAAEVSTETLALLDEREQRRSGAVATPGGRQEQTTEEGIR